MKFILYEYDGDLYRLNQETGEVWKMEYVDVDDNTEKLTWVLIT